MEVEEQRNKRFWSEGIVSTYVEPLATTEMHKTDNLTLVWEKKRNKKKPLIRILFEVLISSQLKDCVTCVLNADWVIITAVSGARYLFGEP